jgi:hypothetical protein
MKNHTATTAAVLFCVATLASGLAQAQTSVQIKWLGMDTAGTKVSSFDTTLSSSPVTQTTYSATALNYTYMATGDSFIAYCIEPQSSNGRKNGVYTYLASTLDTSTGTGKLLEGLYSTQFANLTTYDKKAAFQVAVWEIVREQSGSLDATTGNFHVAAGTSASVISMANSFLSSASSYSGTGAYKFTQLTSVGQQDLLVAAAVPEPQTYAMFLAGLGAIGLLARRRLPR